MILPYREITNEEWRGMNTTMLSAWMRRKHDMYESHRRFQIAVAACGMMPEHVAHQKAQGG